MYLVLSVLCFTVLVVFILMAIFNKHLPKWACTKLGWHVAPTTQGFDGCSVNGCCPRCDKAVMQDSQGNWF